MGAGRAGRRRALAVVSLGVCSLELLNRPRRAPRLFVCRALHLGRRASVPYLHHGTPGDQLASVQGDGSSSVPSSIAATGGCHKTPGRRGRERLTHSAHICQCLCPKRTVRFGGTLWRSRWRSRRDRARDHRKARSHERLYENLSLGCLRTRAQSRYNSWH